MLVTKMEPPTSYGKRLIPQILDNLAAREPDRVIYSVATFSDISPNFRHITASAFAKAVDKTAWWLRGQLGSSASIQTVGYIGPRQSEREKSWFQHDSLTGTR